MPLFVAGAIIGGAAIGAGASYLGSSQQADAAQQAAQTQAQASNAATQLQRDIYNQNRADIAPYREIGTQGLYSLADLIGINRQPSAIPANVQSQIDTLNSQIAGYQNAMNQPENIRAGLVSPNQNTLNDMIAQRDRLMAPYTVPTSGVPSSQFGSLARPFSLADYQADPGYAFRLAEGNKAIDRAAAARGNFFSGATGKALTNYGQDYASNEYAKAYDRYNQNQTNLYNRLAGLSGTGQTATQQTAQYGQNFANQAGQNMLAAGNAAAQGYQNAAAARASGYTGLYNAANAGMGNYLNYNMFNQYLNSPQRGGIYNPNIVNGGLTGLA